MSHKKRLSMPMLYCHSVMIFLLTVKLSVPSSWNDAINGLLLMTIFHYYFSRLLCWTHPECKIYLFLWQNWPTKAWAYVAEEEAICLSISWSVNQSFDYCAWIQWTLLKSHFIFDFSCYQQLERVQNIALWFTDWGYFKMIK